MRPLHVQDEDLQWWRVFEGNWLNRWNKAKTIKATTHHRNHNIIQTKIKIWFSSPGSVEDCTGDKCSKEIDLTHETKPKTIKATTHHSNHNIFRTKIKICFSSPGSVEDCGALGTSGCPRRHLWSPVEHCGSQINFQHKWLLKRKIQKIVKINKQTSTRN